MMRMKPLKDVKRAELYYAKSDAGYYAGEDGLRCEWGGEDAARLGLEGPPEFEHFKNLLHGLDPRSGDQLTAKLISGRIAAWDVTASVPKGVTVALERGDSRIHDAIWRSLRTAMGMLEEYATTRVRAGGKQDDRRTGSLIWYATEHAETRPTIDPLLPEDHKWREMPCPDRHIHCVVPNLTFDAVESQWKAVKFRPIMDIRRFFDRAFDTTLAGELTQLGYEVETKRKTGKYHTWDIKGIPDAVTARFSRRSGEVAAAEAEILAGMKDESGKAPERLSAVARDKLGATSRRVKRDDLTLAECREYWDCCISDDEGRAIDETIKGAILGRNARPEPQAEKAMDFALRHHSELQSAFRWEELAATAMEQSIGAATPAEIRQAAEKRGVIFRKMDGRLMCTTEELQREEDRIVGFAADGRGAVTPVGVHEGLEQGNLERDQWKVVRGLLNSSNAVNVLDAAAGSGKTTLLQTYDRGMRLAGQRVTYLGTTSDSVEVLRGDGFADAGTVAGFLMSDKAQNAARGGRVCIDEASMLGHRDAVRLIDVAREKNLKLIFVGDSRQHRSVNRGELMRVLKDYAGIKPFTLAEIRRQKLNPDYLAAIKLLAKGEAGDGFDALDEKGWVREIDSDQERVAAIAADYLQALREKKTALVVSPTHFEANMITAEIRNQLREAKKLGEKDTTFTRLVPVHASTAERGLRSSYQDGDVIQFTQNCPGFKKGQRIVVSGELSVPIAFAERFQLYRPEPINLAAGDLLRITANITTQSGKTLRNGATHTLSEITPGGNIRLSNGEIVDAGAGHFRHGVVDTTFSAQGKTTRRVIIGMASGSLPAVSMEAMYVAASRAKEWIRLYTDDKEAVREASHRHDARVVALDLRPPKPKPTLRDRMKKLAEWKRRHAYITRVREAEEQELMELRIKPPVSLGHEYRR